MAPIGNPLPVSCECPWFFVNEQNQLVFHSPLELLQNPDQKIQETVRKILMRQKCLRFTKGSLEEFKARLTTPFALGIIPRQELLEGLGVLDKELIPDILRSMIRSHRHESDFPLFAEVLSVFIHRALSAQWVYHHLMRDEHNEPKGCFLDVLVALGSQKHLLFFAGQWDQSELFSAGEKEFLNKIFNQKKEWLPKVYASLRPLRSAESLVQKEEVARMRVLVLPQATEMPFVLPRHLPVG